MSTHLAFGAAALLAFWSVLIAELVGDKSIYALTSLSLRIHWGVVFAAFAAASSMKIMAATLLGSAFMHVHGRWPYVVSAAAFFVSAVLIWVDEPMKIAQENTGRGDWSKGILVCFTSFFFTEWGDPGQIAAAALVLKSHMLLATWIGATLALMTKGVVALALGVQIRNRLPQKTLRIVASGSCCALGILAIVRAS
jgi:putative Ca2+/H+ antiporter (TMEM165/GDT1 family)